VVEVHCEYRASARYDDDLEVRTVGALMSPVRLRFEYRVVRANDEATLATGHTVHASLDASGRPRRLPDRVRAVLGV
jgi:acyl-CoA thioester hydrolase